MYDVELRCALATHLPIRGVPHSSLDPGKPPALSLDSSDRALSIERLRPLVEPKPKMSKEDYVRSFVERGLEARGRHLKGGVEGVPTL